MTSGNFLGIEPQDLQFALELKKQVSCSLQLSNMTDDYVAFQVKTTNPKNYSVRPNVGIVLPRSICDVIVTMQAQKEMPGDMQCKDKFLIQSVVASPGATPKDISSEMFNKNSGHRVEESKLRVLYVSPPRPPSLVTSEFTSVYLGGDSIEKYDLLQGSISYVDPNFEIYKKEMDELQVQLDELSTNQSGATTSVSHGQQSPLVEFFFVEIQEATDSFNPSLKIDEGDYGSLFKGFLHCISVSIKLLQTPSNYHQEVQVANRLRHPNLINLIGVCPEACALIYEHLPNGNLEDRLTNISSPLPWKTRIKISMEICAALIFLHSSNSHPTLHGDLKPINVLLDANLVSKLKDFGIHDHHPDLITVESDVFSFGIILMRLLTGKSDQNLVTEVLDSVNQGNFNTMLDSTAGEWPFVEATQLAHLALSCCKMNNRPDLKFEVWTVLESVRDSCEEVSSNNGNNSTQPGDRAPPPHFVCPIQHEVMQDPVVAADGFSYEAEAIQEWFDLGHDTSPMTNLRLAHKNLIPNQTLRSGIQEWKEN